MHKNHMLTKFNCVMNSEFLESAQIVRHVCVCVCVVVVFPLLFPFVLGILYIIRLFINCFVCFSSSICTCTYTSIYYIYLFLPSVLPPSLLFPSYTIDYRPQPFFVGLRYLVFGFNRLFFIIFIFILGHAYQMFFLHFFTNSKSFISAFFILFPFFR